MTSPPLIIFSESIRTALAHVNHARIDDARLVPETGLVALSVFQSHKMLVGFGVGPIVRGIGLLPRLPQGCASDKHPFVAAMHAHLVGKHIRSVELNDTRISICTESSDAPARLDITIESARVVASTGTVVAWPPNKHSSHRHAPRSAQTSPESSMDAFGKTLVESSDSYVIESLRQELIDALEKKQKRLEKRESAVSADLARVADVPRMQKIGSLLLAQGQTISRKTTEVSLVDWETGDIIVVHIAADKTAKEHAADLFHQARRLQRGACIMQKRLDETLATIASLRESITTIRNAPAHWKTLQTWAASIHRSSAHASAHTTNLRDKRPDERRPYHVFRSTNGQTIFVGRTAKDNDELVTKIARPHDLWLHAKSIRGAHVVVPLEKNHPCPPQVLIDAATLAAHFSNARNETLCEVMVAERRYVSKRKKSAPGEVTTQREKVVLVRIEKDRLSRLLQSKNEM